MANVSASSPSLSATTTPSDWPKDDPNSETHSMVNYYFVFIGLAIVTVTIAAVVTWTRKQRVDLLRERPPRHDPPAGPWNDLHPWEQNHANRHRRSNEYTREEGLNEHGEAPPPYVPPPPNQRGESIGRAPPAVPPRTLSRDQAGLKPPEYGA